MIKIICHHPLIHNLYNEYYVETNCDIKFFDWTENVYKCKADHGDAGWTLNFEDEAYAIMFRLKFGI
jgi:hypothetical protein